VVGEGGGQAEPGAQWQSEPSRPSDPSAGSGPPLARAPAFVARLSPHVHAELVAWARAGAPNEACGIVAGRRAPSDGGNAVRFHPLTNAEASPFLYRIDPVEQLHAMLAIDDADEVVWGIFHSHVASPAEPSVTDVSLAFYPEALYLICSLADPAAPHIRAWSIAGDAVTEVPLQIE
jgi:[CysO sulfur-carrier protein]-S-L-cysteine hydrolase